MKDFGNGCHLLHLALQNSAPANVVQTLVALYPLAVDIRWRSTNTLSTKKTDSIKLVKKIQMTQLDTNQDLLPLSLAVENKLSDNILLSVIPQYITKQRYFEFDVTKYKIQNEVAKMMFKETPDSLNMDFENDTNNILQQIHLTTDGQRYVGDKNHV